MEIIQNKGQNLNYSPEQEALFEAMKSGKPIKKITCMRGTAKKDYPEHDFVLRNITATLYMAGIQTARGEEFDLVSFEPLVDGVGSFYMNWVRSYEI